MLFEFHGFQQHRIGMSNQGRPVAWIGIELGASDGREAEHLEQGLIGVVG